MLKKLIELIKEKRTQKEYLKKQNETTSFLEKIAMFKRHSYDETYSKVIIFKDLLLNNIIIDKKVINKDDIHVLANIIINKMFLNNKEDIEFLLYSKTYCLFQNVYYCYLSSNEYNICFSFNLYKNKDIAFVNSISISFKENDISIETNDKALLDELFENINKTYFSEKQMKIVKLKEFVQEYINKNKGAITNV